MRLVHADVIPFSPRLLLPESIFLSNEKVSIEIQRDDLYGDLFLLVPRLLNRAMFCRTNIHSIDGDDCWTCPAFLCNCRFGGDRDLAFGVHCIFLEPSTG